MSTDAVEVMRQALGACAAPPELSRHCPCRRRGRPPAASRPPQLVRGGRQAWVPMLEEVTATLARRAAQLDLRASPQPYKVGRGAGGGPLQLTVCPRLGWRAGAPCRRSGPEGWAVLKAGRS